LDAVKDQIQEEKDEELGEGAKEAGRGMRKSRRDDNPVDQTGSAMNNISYSQPHVAMMPNNPQGSAPAMVIYAAPGMPPPVSPNIVLSNVQPPPI
jgi:hypothetical protein